MVAPLSTRPTVPAGVWRASELGAAALHTLGSGHRALDRELPGGGWPRASLTEILQAEPGRHEWRLLLPALRRAAQAGPLVLIGPPHLPYLPALAGQGIAAERLLRVEAGTPAERLWAAEQALRCGALGALLLWLPQARPEALRRLQLASASGAVEAGPLVFVFRPLAVQRESSPAPLRLSLQAGPRHGLTVQLLKRRGPLREQPLHLPAALPAVLALRAPREPTGAPAEPALETEHVVDRAGARRRSPAAELLPA